MLEQVNFPSDVETGDLLGALSQGELNATFAAATWMKLLDDVSGAVTSDRAPLAGVYTAVDQLAYTAIASGVALQIRFAVDRLGALGLGSIPQRVPAIQNPSPAAVTQTTAQAVSVEPEIRQLIGQLLDEWRKASAHQSTVRRAAKHPYFQLIRKMGPIAVEMIIDRLRTDPSPLWIWSLGELTGADPARETSSIPEAARAWLQWADQRSIE